ncbi:MAG: helix-turn-helix domain-containing protein [Tannerella sp.]|nr:helix-turn-helix domain-containing protein [Tannerella sp.]
MKRVFILLAFYILTIICCKSEQLRFYGKGELSCNLITDICQDNDGFIWIGTANGLNKFDGWTFSQYFHKNNDANSLRSNYVYALYTDSKGTVWIGSNKGLQCYLPYKDAFQSVTFPDNMQPSVEDITELKTGDIWVATSGRGVFVIDSQTMKATSLDDVNNACGSLFLSIIYEDNNNSIWIPVSNNKVLRIIPGEKKEFRTYGIPGIAESFAEDNDGNLYLSSSSGISKWNPENQSFILLKDLSSQLQKPKILYSNKDLMYVGSYGQGLYSFNPKSLEIKPVNEIVNREVNLEKVKIVSLTEDLNENLWIGCFRKGLLMIPNEPAIFNFWDFSAMEYQSGNCISSVYRDRDGIIWAGAENGEIMKLNQEGRIITSYTLSNTISSTLEDSERTFWIGTYQGGLVQFDKQNGTFRNIPDFKGEYIKSMLEDNYSNIYFSVFGKGLKIYNFHSYEWKSIANKANDNSVFLKNNWINTMINDSGGKVWFGHYKGVDCYDPEKDKFLEIKSDSILYTSICYSLLEGEQNVIWIGTNNGLYKYHSEKDQLEHYSMDDGLPDNVICGLAKDSFGNIWCSTYRGLCKIDVQNGQIHPYSSGNGLFDKEYSRGVYYQYNSDVYFGGVYGITHFLPDSIHRQDIVKEPVITRLYLNNQAVSPHTLSAGKPISDTLLTKASSICLSYKDNTFSLEFSTMDYNEPENIHYEYRMIGINNKWSQTLAGTNSVTYNRLPPGKYTLDVRTRENGIYSPLKTISITIIPPWYLSPVAKGCYILILFLLAGLFIYFLQRRIERLRQEEINEEKLKFFINISHEIRSPITLIISPLSMLLKREYDDATTKALQTMSRNANRIVNLLNQLLDIRKIDKGLMKLAYSETDLVDFIQETIKGFEYQADKWKVSLLFEHSMDSLTAWIDRNNFDKVLINLISNAFKFTPEDGSITISLTTGEDANQKGPLRHYVEICVKDSGIGLDEKKLDKIFERFYQLATTTSSGSGIGLHLCKTLVELHHGQITAANRKDMQGSCFTVRIPQGHEHLKQDEIAEQNVSLRQPTGQATYVDEKNTLRVSQHKSNTKSKVLVIDDSDDICLYLEQELKPYFRIFTCNNGAEGLQTALDIIPDLIISDIVMPEMDGFTLLKKIKKNNNISHIPVILLTSQTEYGYRMKGWDKGADAILTKPFNIEELLLISTNLISGRLRLKGKFTGIQDQKENVNPVELKSAEEQLMERMMQIINKNLDNPELNVELLAKEIGISRVHLHRKLKEITGISTSEFIRNIRLTQAAELLKSKKTNISQVAYAVGYSTPSLFSTAFKKYYGVSPTEYAEGKGER